MPDSEILAALGMSADDLDAEWEAAQAEAVVVLHNAMARMQLTHAFHVWRDRAPREYVRDFHQTLSPPPAAVHQQLRQQQREHQYQYREQQQYHYHQQQRPMLYG